ncbi:MAG: hypothetical protein IKM19_04125 [Firmicutes bacterium]|nr:hypothetical protein [Bacillota bacterium]
MMFAILIVGLLGFFCPGLFIVLPALGIMLLIATLPFMMLGLDSGFAFVLGILLLILIGYCSCKGK